MDKDLFDISIKIVDIALKLGALGIGAIWAVFELKKYRRLQQWIQFDIDLTLYKQKSAVKMAAYSWCNKGKDTVIKPHTHVVEILLKFTNKGKTRARIYNIQAFINTMRPAAETKREQEEGRLILTRIFTSGNIVPRKNKFYYIEPGVEQTISYVALIPEPRDLIQVVGRFSLEEKRIFPEKETDTKDLQPHTTSRIYPVNIEEHPGQEQTKL